MTSPLVYVSLCFSSYERLGEKVVSQRENGEDGKEKKGLRDMRGQRDPYRGFIVTASVYFHRELDIGQRGGIKITFV